MSESTADIDFLDDDHAACRICGGRDVGKIDVREMMFGLREWFLYWECRTCGCLQIAQYLKNAEKYYPNNYYSFSNTELKSPHVGETFFEKYKRIVKGKIINFSARTRSHFLNSGTTSVWLKSRPIASLYLRYVPNPNSKILDVGCGDGTILKDLFLLYYTNLLGCDPFIPNDILYNGKILIRKAWLRDLRPSFDCISFHHVFEHMPDQLTVLKEAQALLTADGVLIIRVPILGGEAWRAYRQDWVQLDAPRHYYSHSERSFRILVEQAGLKIETIIYDSTGFQFWGSEMYRRDIPLMNMREPGKSIESFFQPEKLAEFEGRAENLNRLQDGDQIIAILRRR